MEIMIQWFWLVKLTFFILLLWIAYKALFVHKFKSKVWNVVLASAVIINLISPVKLDVNTKAQTDRANHLISQSKVLPEMIKDNSFEENSSNVKGITDNDLK